MNEWEGNRGSSRSTYGGGSSGQWSSNQGGQWGGNQGRFSGMGPQGYQRSDERITEDINDQLTWHGDLDATNISVKVEKGIVTLSGSVDDRQAKRMAEDVAEQIRGVQDINNQIQVRRQNQSLQRENQGSTSQSSSQGAGSQGSNAQGSKSSRNAQPASA